MVISMPSSDPSLLGWGCNHIQDLKPKRVLDIGIGFGKWGFLVKEYAHKRHPKDSSQVELVGVEVWKDYITPVHNLIYDEIFIGDILEFLKYSESIPYFDLVIMGDVIEHLEKEVGEKLLIDLKNISKRILITTPILFARQEAEYGNLNEIHKSHWKLEDFRSSEIIDESQKGCIFGVYLKGHV